MRDGVDALSAAHTTPSSTFATATRVIDYSAIPRRLGLRRC
jgi:hypothetical protein